MKVIVTGGAGFIGSALVRRLVGMNNHKVLVLDSLGYSGNIDSLASVINSPHFEFKKIDIIDFDRVRYEFKKYEPQAVIHLAAETHVDRSIESPRVFIDTNVVGTFNILEISRDYLACLPTYAKDNFKFIHVSTDEVYGDLNEGVGKFSELSPYNPSSPYAASKAASDHFARAWYRTFGLPTIVTNCSNNYGPYQFPEKLIPHMVLSALSGLPLPVYGSGLQVRDWLHVSDHADALVAVIERGLPGSTYCIGGCSERPNINVVRSICDILELEAGERRPAHISNYHELITFVPDRPGHDIRYAIDPTKIGRELGWCPKTNFEDGLYETVRWYLQNESWWRRVLDGSYRLQRIGR
jgi:dTDP-glucose 4,6-dehydratase